MKHSKSTKVRKSIEHIKEAIKLLNESEVVEAERYVKLLDKMLGNVNTGLNSVFVKETEKSYS